MLPLLSLSLWIKGEHPLVATLFHRFIIHQNPCGVELRSLSALQMVLDPSNPFFIKVMGWFRNYGFFL